MIYTGFLGFKKEIDAYQIYKTKRVSTQSGFDMSSHKNRKEKKEGKNLAGLDAQSILPAPECIPAVYYYQLKILCLPSLSPNNPVQMVLVLGDPDVDLKYLSLSHKRVWG